MVQPVAEKVVELLEGYAWSWKTPPDGATLPGRPL